MALTEHEAFSLLSSLILYVPQQDMQPHLKTVFNLLLTRLQSTKSAKSEHRYAKFSRLISQFFALFVGKYGSQVFTEILNSIQPGLSTTIVASVWVPKVHSDPPQGLDAKTQLIGLTKVLCETPSLLNDAAGQQAWGMVLCTIMTILTSPNASFATAEVDGDEVVEIQYDAQFSGLNFAKKQVVDPFPDVTDPAGAFVKALHALTSQQPGRLLPLIQEGLKNDPKLAPNLEGLFKAQGLSMV